MKKFYIGLGVAILAFIVLWFVLTLVSSIPQLIMVDQSTTILVNAILFLILTLVGCTYVIRDAILKHYDKDKK